MFKFTKKVVKEVEVIKEVEKIVVIGDSVVDVYQVKVPEPPYKSTSSRILYSEPELEQANDEYHKRKEAYENRWGKISRSYFRTADAAFAKAMGHPVIRNKAVTTKDNNIYLLDVRNIISLED